jgi:hypothetical protein
MPLGSTHYGGGYIRLRLILDHELAVKVPEGVEGKHSSSPVVRPTLTNHRFTR